jgi:hypothetical protein
MTKRKLTKTLLDNGPFDNDAFSRLVYWIMERDSIRRKKESGMAQPWTGDLILQRYRFCNVRREDDAVTRWVAANWRQPYGKDKDLWLAMVIARLFNLPSTLSFIHNAMFARKKVAWAADIMKQQLLHLRQGSKGPIFNGAYIVSTNGRAMDKVEYLLQCVLLPMYADAERLRPTKHDTLASFHARLMEYDGMGSFMAAQVVADLKNTTGQVLANATDWQTWAASGPGSRRGMHRLFARDYTQSYREKVWYADMQALLPLVNKATGMDLHAQDVQNCLCEFDKFSRVLFGEGTPKQMYKPKELPW